MKGYGIVIPNDWVVGKWDALATEDIIAQLKALNRDAFYRMAEDVDIDLELLEASGYECDGLSEIAVMELEAFLNADKFQEVQNSITNADYQKDNDFRYVFHRYNDQYNIISDFYSEEKSAKILHSRKFALRNEREVMQKLMLMFINEFVDDKTASRKLVLERYGGHFISMPELDSLLSYRDDISWYHGDAFDTDYKEDIQQIKSLLDLVSLYQVISKGGEFLIKSETYKFQKASLSDASSKILSDAVALALKILYETNPHLCPNADIDKTYNQVDLMSAGKDGAVDKILDSINAVIENHEAESDLNLFYYLADNAIKWPDNITLTQRYMFLYRLAHFFKHIPEKEYEETISTNTRRDIVESIKFAVKQMSKHDYDGDLLKFYSQEDDL